ncbi:Uncharacterised protein g2715 [Pycnogonum litorale]
MNKEKAFTKGGHIFTALRWNCFMSKIQISLIALMYVTLLMLRLRHVSVGRHLEYTLLTGSLLTLLIIFTPILWKYQGFNSHYSLLKICKFGVQFSILAVISIFVTICVLSHNSLWCCVHNDDIRNLCSTADRLGEILKRSNVKYFICYGSALSAHREMGKHIRYEHDVDFCIMKDDNVNFLNALQNSSLVVESDEDNIFMRVFLPGYFYQRIRQNMGMLWIDVYTMCTVNDDSLQRCNEIGPVIKKSLIEPTNTTVNYCGSMFPKPFNLPAYLELNYGSTYMTPILNDLKSVTCSYSPVKC